MQGRKAGDKRFCCEGEMSTIITKPFPLFFVLGVRLIPSEEWRDWERGRCEDTSWRRSMTGTCTRRSGLRERSR
jgi:hypothetical protein